MREKQNYVSTLLPLQNLNQEYREKTKLFLYSSTSSNTEGCAADRYAHIYTRGVRFSQLGINVNLR
jgi:hypothetical protein